MKCRKCGRQGPAGECISCGHWNDAVVLLPNGPMTIDKAFIARALGAVEAAKEEGSQPSSEGEKR